MFSVMSENNKYKLNLDKYSGDTLRFYSLSCRNNVFINLFSYAYKILGLKQQLGVTESLEGNLSREGLPRPLFQLSTKNRWSKDRSDN